MRWILILLTIFFLWALVSRFTELEELKNTLQQGQWSWILAALFFQTFYFLAYTSSYQAAFEALHINTRTRDLLPITLGALFVNMIVPVSIAGSAALFAQHIARRGQPAARAATGILLQLIADFMAFTFVLVPGLIYLFYEHDLESYEIVAAILLLLMTIGMSGILLLGIWKPVWLYRVFDAAQRITNSLSQRIRHLSLLAEDWAQKNAVEFSSLERGGRPTFASDADVWSCAPRPFARYRNAV